MSSARTVAVILVLYCVATTATTAASPGMADLSHPVGRRELDLDSDSHLMERNAQAGDAAASPSYNNGQYTPWTGTTAARATAAPSPTSVKATAVSAASSPAAAATSAVASSSAAATSLPASPTASSGSSASTSSGSASASPSSSSSTASSSPYTSWVEPPPQTGNYYLTLSPYTVPTISPPSSTAGSLPSSGTANSASTSGSASTGAGFKPIYLVPVLVLLLSVLGYFVGRWLYRRRQRRAGRGRGGRSVGVGSLYTQEADLGWEDDGKSGSARAYGIGSKSMSKSDPAGYPAHGGYDEEKRAGSPDPQDATEALVHGWRAHTLRYSSTDIFGEEPSAPLPAYTQPNSDPDSHPTAYAQPQRTGYTQPSIGFGFGAAAAYQPVPATPSKPKPKSTRGQSLYRAASRLLPRRPSWFVRPQTAGWHGLDQGLDQGLGQGQGQGRLYGPRVAPPRGHHPAAAAPPTYGPQWDGSAPARAYEHEHDYSQQHPAGEEQEEVVRRLLVERVRPIRELALPERVQPGRAEPGYSHHHSRTQSQAQQYPSQPSQPQHAQDHQPYPSTPDYPLQTPMTASTASVYSLASPPPTGTPRMPRMPRLQMQMQAQAQGQGQSTSESLYSLSSPPPAPVRGMGGRGTGRAMERVWEAEEWDVPVGGLRYR
ncbi:hypothetical protein CALCODRAFT_485870 [Calocera cornea HHB12733]|uniref:Proteophosphoglycan ppg4 n=1 Tax=Calocera cornea HHB12733 TaxID=1353952 RepID=A0A165E3M4_9BASI|nr:hypothetical protein CALCODRAFT_485870 [Calocera cornea HHB12733]